MPRIVRHRGIGATFQDKGETALWRESHFSDNGHFMGIMNGSDWLRGAAIHRTHSRCRSGWYWLQPLDNTLTGLLAQSRHAYVWTVLRNVKITVKGNHPRTWLF